MKPALQTRLIAYLAVKDVVEKKITAPLALNRIKNFNQLNELDSKFTKSLVFETLRHYGQAKTILNQYIKRKFSGKKKDVEYVLVMAIVQLKYLKIPSHAVVDTAVELIKEIKQKYFSGLVNAILHAISRNIDKNNPDALTNLPSWMCEKWVATYGEEQVRSFLDVFNGDMFLDISVKDDTEIWVKKLNAEVLPTGTLRCHMVENITSLDGYEEGAWWVQDASAALPVHLFSNVKGKRGADLCSAPGGKTAQLVAKGAYVDAYDISEKRLIRLKENIKRLNIEDKVTVICSDALQIEQDELYDFILLDAPCSATGTIKRHPDLLHIRTYEDVMRLSQLQKELLTHAVSLLKKGGELVYSTCSLEDEENELLIQSFLKEHTNMKRHTPTAPFLKPFLNEFGAVQVLPSNKIVQDGFYAVLLKKE